MNQSEYAKHLGISQQRVSKMLEKGIISRGVVVTRRGSKETYDITPEEADVDYEENRSLMNRPETKKKAAKRYKVTKAIRFEVFKRDDFTCTYCGKSPPGVELEVDHIDPHSRGGKDGMENYTTACFDCNRGKDDKDLEKLPATISKKKADAKKKRDEIRKTIEDSGIGSFGTLSEAQVVKETYMGALRKLEYEEKSGKVVQASEVAKDADRVGRLIKERSTALPARIAPLVAVESDPFKCEQIMKKEVDQYLEELSKEVSE